MFFSSFALHNPNNTLFLFPIAIKTRPWKQTQKGSLSPMDLQLKQWRSQQQQQTESEDQPSAAKIPKHVFDQIQSQTATSTALPLFSPEPTASKLSSLSQDSSSRFPSESFYNSEMDCSLIIDMCFRFWCGFCLFFFLFVCRDWELF